MRTIDVKRAERLEEDTLAALWEIEERLHCILEEWRKMSLDGQSSLWHQYDFDSGRLSVARGICDDFLRGSEEYDDRITARDDQRHEARMREALAAITPPSESDA